MIRVGSAKIDSEQMQFEVNASQSWVKLFAQVFVIFAFGRGRFGEVRRKPHGDLACIESQCMPESALQLPFIRPFLFLKIVS
jgi:hypothetical protein